jgi:hypothetical protein
VKGGRLRAAGLRPAARRELRVSGCPPWVREDIVRARRLGDAPRRAEFATLAVMPGDTMSCFSLGDFFLWCTILNYLILILWFVAFSLGHDWMFRLHGRWFRLTTAQFDALHYGAWPFIRSASCF